jgi:hypothetical protein
VWLVGRCGSLAVCVGRSARVAIARSGIRAGRRGIWALGGRRMTSGPAPGSPGLRASLRPAANAGRSESRIAGRRLACGECWTVGVQDHGQAGGLRRMLDGGSPGSRADGWPAANAGRWQSRITGRRLACGECWTVAVQDHGQTGGLRRMLDGGSPGSRAGGWSAANAGRWQSRITGRRVSCGECWTVAVQDLGHAGVLRRMLDGGPSRASGRK